MHILSVGVYWHYPQVALEFLQMVQKKGHKVSVLLGNGEGASHEELFDNDIDFFFAPKWDFLSKITGTPYPIFKNVSSWIKMVNPDIVHVNSHLFFSNYQAMRASSSLDIPSVVTIHGFMVSRSLTLNALQVVYLRTVARSIFLKTSRIICLTDNDAANVAGIIGNYDKISIIPNGVNTDLFKPSTVKNPNSIVWVGRLVPEKGLVYLLKAMQEIVKEFPDSKLTLIGDGVSKGELMRLTNELGLRDKTRFLGSVDRSEVARVLSESAVFAFPSLREGLPLSVLEAMACGVPVVGSHISGIGDVVTHGQNGLLVPARNPEALVNAALTLLGDESLRKRLGQNARQLMIEKYSWDMIIKKIEKVYYEAIGEACVPKEIKTEQRK